MPEMTGKVYPVHNNKFKIGIGGLESTDDQMTIIKDLENFAPVIDGTLEEWYAMDAEGWAKSAVTGKKLSISFSGKRAVGDPGNDYVAGKALAMGQEAMSRFEWDMISGAKMTFPCVINVTTPGGGDTTNLDKLAFDVICYGKPTFTAADAGTEATDAGTEATDEQ